jgi:hypothetical protein
MKETGKKGARGPRKAQVAVVHRKLASVQDATRMKAFWKERLARLEELLEEPDA